jgi:YHS domain-containing protein
MYKRIFVTLFVVMAVALMYTATVSAQTGQKPAGKETTGKPMMHHGFANMLAVCGCGKVFKPDANTKTFIYEGKEYACCSEECHKKLASMNPADAAKACEDQIKKLETLSAAPAPAPAKK